MKNRLLLSALLLCITFFDLQAQIPWNYYRFYFRIQVQDNTLRVFDQRSNNNVWCNVRHGENNQQWVIMPMYLKSDNGVLSNSNEYIIASRRDGDVLDINSSNNAYGNSDFHGGNNQIFTLNPTGTGASVFFISSPKNTNKVLDKRSNSNGSNIYFNTYHGSDNQQFSLTTHNSFRNSFSPLRNIVRTQPPAPSSPQSFNESMPTETAKFFKSETLIPYAMVKNDFAPAYQVEYTPYYRLVRSQYYRFPNDIDSDITYIPGESLQTKITTKTGMKLTSVIEVSRKLNVSFTASGEVSGPLAKVLTFKAAQSISTSMELAVKNINTYEETKESALEITYEFNTTQAVRLVTYQLVDYYELFRQDGTLVTSWEVGTKQAHRVQYPAEDSGDGRVDEGESFILENGSVIPIYGTTHSTAVQATDADEVLATPSEGSDGTFKLSVSPNPTTGTLKLNYHSLSKENQIVYYIFSLEGTLYKKEKLQFSPTGNVIDISNLPSGLYLVKVVAGQQHSSIVRVQKE